MSGASFPEYAIKYAESARKSRLALTPALRQAADEIEAEMTVDPDRYPERMTPASVDGRSRIYQHPSPQLQITFEADRDRKIIYIFYYSGPTLTPQQTIFVSYSHEDKPWLEKLKVFLTVLEQQGLIRFWDDSQLVAGVPWETQIKEVLDGSRAGLLLVSQHFLISPFVREVELPKLLDVAVRAGKRIYWLPLSPSTVFETHKEITVYQSLLDNPEISLEQLDEVKQKMAFVQVTKTLMQHAKAS
jgi:hypothetical protein